MHIFALFFGLIGFILKAAFALVGFVLKFTFGLIFVGFILFLLLTFGLLHLIGLF